MLALYNILAILLWPLLCFYPPFRGTIRRRLGGFDSQRYDTGKPGLRVLINAVSAGEVVAITSFINELLAAHPDTQVAVLTTTQSGQEMAERQLGDKLALLAYFPLIDLPFAVRRYLDRLQPDLYMTTESELWPNILLQCRSRQIPTALVNARIYLHNKAGIRGRIVRRLYELLDLIVCQDEMQRERFAQFGVPANKLEASGNIKFDVTFDEWDAARLTAELERYGLLDLPVIVAGSTHPGEEELLLEVLQASRQQIENTKLILAPRHVDRASEIAGLATDCGLNAVCLSEYEPGQDYDVLIIDRYGVLMDFYRLATVVVMGGTYHEKVGGHNILEATVLGKPVIIGPHQFSITSQVEMLEGAEGIIQAPDGNKLTEQLVRLLADNQRAQTVGSNAQTATLANRGAARRAVSQILGLVD